jgi:hypothetical protein
VSADLVANVVVAGVLTGLVYGLMALGLSVIFGVVRVVNFAHGEMMTVAMYATTVLFAAFKLDHGRRREKAMALVQRAIAHLRQHGPRKAFADFNRREGGFVDADYYLIAHDLNCVMQANGANPALVGQDHSDLKDSDGKRFSWETVRVARERGSGWVDYRWTNPRTGRVQPKSTYAELAGEFVIGCGIYLED